MLLVEAPLLCFACGLWEDLSAHSARGRMGVDGVHHVRNLELTNCEEEWLTMFGSRSSPAQATST